MPPGVGCCLKKRQLFFNIPSAGASFVCKRLKTDMKKIILTLTLLLSATFLWAGKPINKVQTLVNEYRHNDGFDYVSLGPLALKLVKAVAFHDADMDPEDREILRSFSDIRRLTVLDFEDARDDVKERFVQKVQQALKGMELILEAKDDGDRLSIYGMDDGEKIHDCILWNPEGTLICVRGTVTLDKLMEAVND